MDNHQASGTQSSFGSDPIGSPQTGTGASLGETLTGIIQDLQNIIRGEVQLAKTEIKEDTSKLGKGAGMIAAAALVALVGFIFLMLGVTYLLNKSIEMWMAAGIVGLVLLLIGTMVGMAGKKQMQAANLMPTKTIESLKEDKEWTSRQIKSVKN